MSPAGVEDALKFREYVVEALSGLDNAKTFDFQGEGDLILNHDYYSDSHHYKSYIGLRILEDMAAGRNIVTPDNAPQYTRRLRELIRSVDVDELDRKLGIEG